MSLYKWQKRGDSWEATFTKTGSVVADLQLGAEGWELRIYNSGEPMIPDGRFEPNDVAGAMEYGEGVLDYIMFEDDEETLAIRDAILEKFPIMAKYFKAPEKKERKKATLVKRSKEEQAELQRKQAERQAKKGEQQKVIDAQKRDKIFHMVLVELPIDWSPSLFTKKGQSYHIKSLKFMRLDTKEVYVYHLHDERREGPYSGLFRDLDRELEYLFPDLKTRKDKIIIKNVCEWVPVTGDARRVKGQKFFRPTEQTQVLTYINGQMSDPRKMTAKESDVV